MTLETKCSVLAFYRFTTMTEQELEQRLQFLGASANELEIGGLIILALEGINGTVSGSEDNIARFKSRLIDEFGLEEEDFKIAFSDSSAFKRFKIKVREEIVTTGVESPPQVPAESNTHLSPEEWHEALSTKEDITLLDTRNWYECDLGTFKGAEDPRLINFQDFENYVRKSEIPKDKEVYMYCTGGIRCEKASLLMQNMGYEKVYQLQGGILKYMEQYPDGHFEGECFVFDQRVAVDKNLEPTTRYSLCPHSGQPGSNEIRCRQCGAVAKVSDPCLGVEALETCSKHCANLYREKSASAQS